MTMIDPFSTGIENRMEIKHLIENTRTLTEGERQLLQALAESDDLNKTKAASELGYTKQRAHQIFISAAGKIRRAVEIAERRLQW
jgi:DNA-directed RNA polymerase specialized sigma subunit